MRFLIVEADGPYAKGHVVTASKADLSAPLPKKNAKAPVHFVDSGRLKAWQAAGRVKPLPSEEALPADPEGAVAE